MVTLLSNLVAEMIVAAHLNRLAHVVVTELLDLVADMKILDLHLELGLWIVDRVHDLVDEMIYYTLVSADQCGIRRPCCLDNQRIVCPSSSQRGPQLS
jgi:hypothetical protein